jgi:hypothetical protein
MLRCSIRLFALVLLLLTSIRTSRDVAAAVSPTCRHVQGILQETATLPCPSPVGLCTIGRLIGNVTGEAHFVALTFDASPVAGTFFITGDTLIVNAQFEGRRGTVSTRNAAVFRPASGDLVDLQTIVGGTGDFSGATGTLQLTGTFVGTSGESTVEGTVCFP